MTDFSKRVLFTLLFTALPALGYAQTDNPAIPNSIDVLVVPPGSDPNTAPPVGTRNSAISPGSPNCNIQTLPAPAATPLVNPTKAYFDDPFEGHQGRYCYADLPTGLPNGNGYVAVGVFKADTCTINGSTVTPCPSLRSMAGQPPFNIQSVLTRPAPPTGVAVRP